MALSDHVLGPGLWDAQDVCLGDRERTDDGISRDQTTPGALQKRLIRLRDIYPKLQRRVHQHIDLTARVGREVIGMKVLRI